MRHWGKEQGWGKGGIVRNSVRSTQGKRSCLGHSRDEQGWGSEGIVRNFWIFQRSTSCIPHCFLQSSWERGNLCSVLSLHCWRWGWGWVWALRLGLGFGFQIGVGVGLWVWVLELSLGLGVGFGVGFGVGAGFGCWGWVWALGFGVGIWALGLGLGLGLGFGSSQLLLPQVHLETSTGLGLNSKCRHHRDLTHSKLEPVGSRAQVWAPAEAQPEPLGFCHFRAVLSDLLLSGGVPT